MLPASRVLSAIAIGIGLALLVGAGLAPRYLHIDSRLPLDVKHTTFRLVDEETGYQHQLHWDLLEPADAESVSVRVGSSTLRESEPGEPAELVDAEVWAFDLDRISGQALSTAQLSHTLVTPAAHVDIAGQWLKFPVGAEKTNYEVFDPTLRESASAAFQEVVTVDGVELYRYRQVIEPVNVATKYADQRNTKREEVLAPEDPAPADPAPEDPAAEPAEEDQSPEQPAMVSGRQLYLHHAATRDFFVHPRTGMIVDLHENIDDYYATGEGERVEHAVVYQAQLAAEDVDKLIVQAESFANADTVNTIRYIVLAVGAVITLVALIGVFGGFRRRSH